MIGKFGLSACIASATLAFGASMAPAQSAITACEEGELLCLDQGWNELQRAYWYTTSQGSRLVPLAWALALETADGSEKIFARNHLLGLGYLENPASEANPFGLPVGFAVDHLDDRASNIMCDTFPETCRAQTMRAPWVGLNCSACHTNEIEANGRRIRIEGAPTLADFEGLVGGIEEGLRATQDDTARFERFALSVLQGRRDDSSWESLRTQIEEQIAWMEALREANGASVEAGPARLDAQGHILTKVSMVNGAGDQTREFESDAPGSYPFIWNTSQQSKLQWNGIASSVADIELVPGRSTELGALIRNTSEVIGVFAHVDAGRGKAWRGYESSVRVRELIGLERLVANLKSPVWSENLLGPINRDLAASGRTLFDDNCASCHAHLEHDDLTSDAMDQMTPLTEAGTDVFLACNTYLRTNKAGNMAGQKTYGFTGDRIKDTDATRAMLINVSVGTIVEKRGEVIRSIFTDIGPELPAVPMPPALTQVTYLPGVADQVKRDRARKCLTEEHALLAYKARPLNGIWATAPYLHNGSVPTLYDLLLPAKVRNIGTLTPVDIQGPARPESFGVGGRSFDTANVGFSVAEEDNLWMFNVRDEDGNVIPGNSNGGHDYGNAGFTEEERRAIVEYLKTL